MIDRRLLAYAPWHLRDSLLRSLAPIGLFAALAGSGLAFMVRGAGVEAVRSGELRGAALQNYTNGLALAMTLGALLIASGYVAQERTQGHVRFLFSAPVVPWQFYLLRFAIGLACFVAATTAIPVGFSLLLFPVPISPVALSAAMYALLFGALSLLAGSLTRHDGAVVIGVTMAASVLQPFARGDQLPDWLDALATALPPIKAADDVRTAWLTGSAGNAGDLVLVLGYAVAMLVASLLIIRRAPLVR